jgi:hypothetical protein
VWPPLQLDVRRSSFPHSRNSNPSGTRRSV